MLFFGDTRLRPFGAGLVPVLLRTRTILTRERRWRGWRPIEEVSFDGFAVEFGTYKVWSTWLQTVFLLLCPSEDHFFSETFLASERLCPKILALVLRWHKVTLTAELWDDRPFQHGDKN